MMGLTLGSYEAYCLDQAVWYLGITITSELEKVGQKRQKGQAAQEGARKRVLAKYLGDEKSMKQQYADPALIFGAQ